jgi:hypothetical protein
MFTSKGERSGLIRKRKRGEEVLVCKQYTLLYESGLKNFVKSHTSPYEEDAEIFQVPHLTQGERPRNFSSPTSPPMRTSPKFFPLLTLVPYFTL